MFICRLIICLSIFLLSSLNFGSSARVRDWDAVLDKYERLCDRCLELKKQEKAGQAVSKRALRQLMKELSSLKNELKEGSGKMSIAQRERFQRIRSKILSEPTQVPVSSPSISSVATVAAASFPAPSPPSPPASPTPEPEPELPSGPAPVPQIHVRMPVKAEYNEPDSLRVPQIKDAVPATRSQLLGRKFFVSGIASTCIYPKSSFGIMCAVDPTDYLWGAYARFSSNYQSRGYDYDCLSNGDTGSGAIWTSGESLYSTWLWAVGPCYRLKPWLRVYAGLGYGKVRTYWEDSSGYWARVTDLSPEGLLLDAGSLFSLGKLELNAGISVTAFRLASFHIGIGYNF